MKATKQLCFIITYFGQFPNWFPAFLHSCESNQNIDWLIWHDNKDINFIYPSNVHFSLLSLEDFIKRASTEMETKIVIEHPHKLCDFKPIYGAIFQSDIDQYSYWGHCDLDLIWGDIESFLEQIDYQKYDIISTRRASICGHFTLYRNNESTRQYYRKVPNFEKAFLNPKYSGFDEGFYSYQMYKDDQILDFEFNIFWPKKYAVDWPELQTKPYGWRWKNGKILDKHGKERIYLHFMKWKKSMSKIDFTYGDSPNQFFITKHGLWSSNMSLKERINYWWPSHLPNWFRLKKNGLKLRIKHLFYKPTTIKEPPIPEEYKEIL